MTDLGYNSFFETGREQLGLAGFPVARVISEFKEAYRVKNETGERLAKVTGKRMFSASSREDYPAVGDWVAISEPDDDHAIIRGILPRMTTIERRRGDDAQIIAANVDVAFVVESVDRDYNLNRLERYFAIARNGGVRPAVALNKTDLLAKEELDKRLAQMAERLPGIDIIPTSIVSDAGLDDLKRFIKKGKTYCFLGSSGVGKSSLINKLLGADRIETRDISSYSGRGKHTTTGRQMYFLENGGIVIDNPGMREVGMTDMSQGISAVFGEISSLARECKYADCAHAGEPGCMVLGAVELGKLDKQKYANYISLKKEADYYEMSDAEKRAKDRRFGKFINEVKKDLKKLRDKN